MKDDISTGGILDVFIFNDDTRIMRCYRFENTLTQEFLNRQAQWNAGVNNTGQNAVSPPTKFQMGTGTGTANINDTTLFTPNASSLKSISTRSVSTNVTTYTISYPKGVLDATTYTEAGLIGEDGALLTHLVMTTSVSIASNESATFQYTLTSNAG